MKNNVIQTKLKDVLNFIDEIEKFTEDIKDYDTFGRNVMCERACEHNIMNISEAMRKILDEDENFFEKNSISNGYKIIKIRDIMAHGYDTINLKIVWGVVKNSLPILKKEIKKNLKRYTKKRR